MYFHYLQFGVLVLIVILMKAIPGISFSAEISPVITRFDSESTLARGEKLALSGVTQTDLELIPGFGKSKSGELLKLKEKLLAQPKKYLEREPCSVLQEVKGIGKKNCGKFLGYLELR